jgi:2-dehydropantoate 2-reductase
MAKVAIVGVGAIGGVVAALLQQTGRHQLILCTRRPMSALTVETPHGTITIDAVYTTDPNEVSGVDWAVVATKAYDAEGTAKWLKPLAAKGVPAAIFQNGIEHRERLAPYLPVESILPVMVDCPAERPSPDHVRQRGKMFIKVQDSPAGNSLVELFAGSDADASVVPDFKSVVWKKLCYNSAGILPALLLKPAGVMRGEAIGDVGLQIIRECIAVGRAEGAVLSDEIAEEILKVYRSSPPDSMNSLHVDRVEGRPMEIDARNGVIVRLGEKHGIPTPSNRMAVTLLEEMVKKS